MAQSIDFEEDTDISQGSFFTTAVSWASLAFLRSY